MKINFPVWGVSYRLSKSTVFYGDIRLGHAEQHCTVIVQVYSSLFSTVQLPDSSLAIVEVLFTLLEKLWKDRYWVCPKLWKLNLFTLYKFFINMFLASIFLLQTNYLISLRLWFRNNFYGQQVWSKVHLSS